MSSQHSRHRVELSSFVHAADFDLVAKASICYVIKITYVRRNIHTSVVRYKQALLMYVFTNNGKFHSPCNSDVCGKQRVEKKTQTKRCIHVHQEICTCMRVFVCECVAKLPEHDSHYWVNRLMESSEKNRACHGKNSRELLNQRRS